jgi:hypothetical protein
VPVQQAQRSPKSLNWATISNNFAHKAVYFCCCIPKYGEIASIHYDTIWEMMHCIKIQARQVSIGKWKACLPGQAFVASFRAERMVAVERDGFISHAPVCQNLI